MENTTSTVSFASYPPRIDEQIDRLRHKAWEISIEPSCILMGVATYAKFHLEMRELVPFLCVGNISKYKGLQIHILPLSWYLELGYAEYRHALCAQLERNKE